MKVLEEQMRHTQVELAKIVKDVQAKYDHQKQKTRRLAKDNESLKKKILALKKEQANQNFLKTIDEREEDSLRRKAAEVVESPIDNEDSEENANGKIGHRYTLKMSKHNLSH